MARGEVPSAWLPLASGSPDTAVEAERLGGRSGAGSFLIGSAICRPRVRSGQLRLAVAASTVVPESRRPGRQLWLNTRSRLALRSRPQSPRSRSLGSCGSAHLPASISARGELEWKRRVIMFRAFGRPSTSTPGEFRRAFGREPKEKHDDEFAVRSSGSSQSTHLTSRSSKSQRVPRQFWRQRRRMAWRLRRSPRRCP